MSIKRVSVNPHRINLDRIPRIDDRVLHDLIALSVAGDMPRNRLAAAGIPSLHELERERRRRQREFREVA
jgi:hypothetical protein